MFPVVSVREESWQFQWNHGSDQTGEQGYCGYPTIVGQVDLAHVDSIRVMVTRGGAIFGFFALMSRMMAMRVMKVWSCDMVVCLTRNMPVVRVRNSELNQTQKYDRNQ